ncbi:MAG: CPBP family intramembrane glutamic endopeptidase [Terrimicrobiaceae bacterium]
MITSWGRERPILLIFLAFVFVVLATCLISPLAYWTVQRFAEVPWIAPIAGFPFHRFFSRTAQICLIVTLVPVAFLLGISKLRDLGLEKNRRRFADVAVGIFAALLPVLILATIYVWNDVYRPRNERDLSPLLRIFLTAGVVSCLEEFLFRGVFLGLAIRSMGAVRGSVLVSLVFAAVHFLRPAKPATAEVTWASGFSQLGAVFDNLPALPILGFGFLTLLVAGLILAWVTIKTRSLWLAIGLHAGWIVGQQGLNWYAKFRASPPDEFLPWLGPNVVSGVVPTGILPLLALGLAAALVAGYLHYGYRQRPSLRP